MGCMVIRLEINPEFGPSSIPGFNIYHNVDYKSLVPIGYLIIEPPRAVPVSSEEILEKFDRYVNLWH